jgi:hypothetical protein
MHIVAPYQALQMYQLGSFAKICFCRRSCNSGIHIKKQSFLKNMVFWFEMCSRIDGYKYLGRTYRPHFEGK